MCRITAIKGSLSNKTNISSLVDRLQEYGGTIKQEEYAENDLKIFLNRFDVTTSQFKSGEFPLANKNFVFAYNGEVYSFRGNVFKNSKDVSDAHFAFNLIEEFGHQVFFAEADFEGTFMLYDKKKKILFIYADQLNTKGCFYAITDKNIIVTQELSILNSLLEYAKEKKNIAIHSLKRGHCLEIPYNNSYKTYEYKPNFKNIWGGSGENKITKRKESLYKSLVKAVNSRIPREGNFGILCGGGIDSSLIVKIAVDILIKKKQLNRLKIFTLGTPDNPLRGEDNDWENTNYLLSELGHSDLLHLAYPFADWNKYLLEKEILSDNPHLITPNPVQTQVRHTMTMSTVLAQFAIKFPDINVVLTGDFADEIFGGYNSMHNGSIDDLKTIIQHKLDDLHLNDAARVTLASLRGCKYVVKMLLEGNLDSSPFTKHKSSQHPIEVRTPFASPLLADAIKGFPGSDLVGRHNKKIHSKYILRLVAEMAGVPEKIAWRKKVPFNEGGTGIRNAEPYLLEEMRAIQFLECKNDVLSEIDTSYLLKLGIEDYTIMGKKNSYEFALYCASMHVGLRQLMRGNSFRALMPDSNYSSIGNLEIIYSKENK